MRCLLILLISRWIPVGKCCFSPRVDVPGRSIFLLWRRSSMWRHPSSLSFIRTRMDSGGSSVSLLGSTPFRTGVALDDFVASVLSQNVGRVSAAHPLLENLLYLEEGHLVIGADILILDSLRNRKDINTTWTLSPLHSSHTDAACYKQPTAPPYMFVNDLNLQLPKTHSDLNGVDFWWILDT